MKKIALAIATVFTAAAPAAFAQYDRYDSRYDSRDRVELRDSRDYNYWRDRDGRRETARVIESRPVYAASDSREECFNPRTGNYESVREGNDNRPGAGAAIGAVAGGVAGHQVGSGRGNTAATVGGALIGGLIGHQVEKRRNDDNQVLDRSRCRVASYGSDSAQGYDVRYEYDGREYVTRLDHDPGRRLVIGQDINPDGTPMR